MELALIGDEVALSFFTSLGSFDLEQGATNLARGTNLLTSRREFPKSREFPKKT